MPWAGIDPVIAARQGSRKPDRSRLHIDCDRHLCVSYRLRPPSLGGARHDEERIMASKQSGDLAEVSGAAQLPWALRNGQTGHRKSKENQMRQTTEDTNKALIWRAFTTH